jgi:2-polyprenyl-3-methyl-5-hydroxy-6-metoxy-1,4-benzoquinol methylase
MVQHVCPVWMGYVLANPTRKLFQNPGRILRPYVNEGMKVLDIGCAMGFFSLPLARMVGAGGKVICVDIQERMIKLLEKRARKAGLSGRIETLVCNDKSLGLDGIKETVDFALAFAVVHEVSDPAGFFSEIHGAMKPAGRLLASEPKGRVSEKDFDRTISVAERNGFLVMERPRIRSSRAVVLQKVSDKIERGK